MMGDPVQLDNAHDLEPAAVLQARARAWRRSVFAVTLAQKIDLPKKLHPYLVALDGPDDPWLERTWESAVGERHRCEGEGLVSSGAGPHRIGGWLQSSLSPHDLAKRVGSLMSVNTEASTAAQYQRLADRRALSLIRHVVGDQRLQSAAAGIEFWNYLDARGCLGTIRGARHAEPTPLRLSRAEWSTFIRGELLHPTISRWLGELSARARSNAPIQVPGSESEGLVFERAIAALARADVALRQWHKRFATPADQCAWAALTLVFPAIDTSRRVNALLEEPALDGESPMGIDAMMSSLMPLCEEVLP